MEVTNENSVEQLQTYLESTQAFSEDEIKTIIDHLRAQEVFCIWPWIKFFIQNDGKVYICCRCNWSIGNVNDNSIDEIWNGESVKELRRRFLSGNYSMCDIRCPFILESQKKKDKERAEKAAI